MRLDGGNAEAVLAEIVRAGVNDEALAADLQREGTAAFAKSWSDLMSHIASKSYVLTKAKQA
jgi:transaldolase